MKCARTYRWARMHRHHAVFRELGRLFAVRSCADCIQICSDLICGGHRRRISFLVWHPCHKEKFMKGVCLPQIKPEHIGDAVPPGSGGTERVPLPRRHVISARLCSTISECACHYSSPCRTAAHGADGVRRTPRYDRGIPYGSSRSTVLRMRFARVNAETSGGLECRSIERGG